MMSKEKSPMIRQVRYLLVLPVVVLLMLFFSGQGTAFAQEKKKMQEIPPPPPPPPPPLGYEVLENGDSVFFDVDEAPSFQGGGIEAVQKYVQEKLKYPAAAKESKIQGKVMVQWIVNEKGKVTNVNVVRGVTTELDQEAFNVIASMPDWKPGIKDGKAVKVKFTMPIKFSLEPK